MFVLHLFYLMLCASIKCTLMNNLFFICASATCIRVFPSVFCKYVFELFSGYVYVHFFCRLTYGLDYKGNVCGDKHADPDLRELEVRCWMNPNQVYESGLKSSQFKLADARSICLMECPVPSDDGLNWICDYPEGDIRLTVDDWIDRDYDYYEFLTPEMRNSSLQLQGPCYPVIYPSVNGKY